MADRRPLIINSSAQQIQELATSDALIGNGTFPLGGIIMWSGAISAIPTGWSLCNGSNGTPDLRNKFVLGATNDGSDSTYPGISVDETGGSANATLVTHSHTTNSTINEGDTNAKSLTGTFANEPHSTAPTGIFTQTSQNFNEDADQGSNGRLISIDATHRHTTDTQGSSATNANLPPFLALAYIQRTS